jgi:hypothetical protein
MAGQYPGQIGEGEELPFDAVEQFGGIPSWEIASADRVLEEHISADAKVMTDEHHMPWGMAGGVAHLEAEPPKGEDVTMGQIVVGGTEPREAFETEHLPLFRERVIPLAISRMQPDLSPSGLAHSVDTPDVVDVGVGEPDLPDIECAVADRRQNARRVLTWIHHGGLT